MAHTTETRAASPASGTGGPVVLLTQVLATLSVVNLLFQYVTAGTLVTRGGSDALEGAHGTGAIVLHVLTGLTAIAAAVLWRQRGVALWPAIVAFVVFVLSFVQAYYGGGRTLYIHVPGAMILTVGSVVVMAWAFSRGARVRD